MLIPWISRTSRKNSPRTRGTRRDPVHIPQVERLEDRTALSTALAGSAVTQIVSRPAESIPGNVGLFATLEFAPRFDVIRAPAPDVRPPDLRSMNLPFATVSEDVERGMEFELTDGLFVYDISRGGNVGSPPFPFAMYSVVIRPDMFFPAFIQRGVFRFPERPISNLEFMTSSGLNFDSLIPLVMQFATNKSSVTAHSPTSSNSSSQEASHGITSSEGWMSFIATGGWGSPIFQSQTYHSNDDPVSTEESSPTIPPVSGESSWSEFLTGPDALNAGLPEDLEQVIELAPLPGASHALIATLWTVSSDSSSAQEEWSSPSDGRLVPITAASAWVSFVIGLDDALEQSRDQARASIFSDECQPTDEGRARDAIDVPFDSSPVVLIRPGSVLVAAGPLRGPGDAAAVGGTGIQPTNAETERPTVLIPPVPLGLTGPLTLEEEPQTDAEAPGPLAAWGVSLLSFSASVFIAGKAWTKRRRDGWLRPGRFVPGLTDSKNSLP
jgi:hypothetical protein